MARTVLDSQTVSHYWANRRQPNARTSNDSFSFEGEVLYSYRTPIARLHELDGHTLVLHSCASHSVTTSKHQSLARRASSQYDDLTVHSIPGNAWGEGQYSIGLTWALDEIEQQITGLNDCKGRVARARKNKDWALKEFNSLYDNCSTLIAFVYEHCPQRTDERLALATRQLEEAMKQPSSWDELRKQLASKAAEEAKAEKVKQAEALTMWRAFEPLTGNTRLDYSYSYLRYNAATEEVETSKGVRIPKLEAMKAIAAFRQGRLLGEKLNGFIITQVDSTRQVIVAGCHTVRFSELDFIESALREAVAA